MKILVFFFFSTFIGYAALIFVQRSRLYKKSSLEGGASSIDEVIELAKNYPPEFPLQKKNPLLNMFHQGDIDGFKRERDCMQKTYSFKSYSSSNIKSYSSSNKKDDPVSRTATRPPNDCTELAKVLAEAAIAHRAAAAASEAVAAQYEKLSTIASFQSSEHASSPPICKYALSSSQGCD